MKTTYNNRTLRTSKADKSLLQEFKDLELQLTIQQNKLERLEVEASYTAFPTELERYKLTTSIKIQRRLVEKLKLHKADFETKILNILSTYSQNKQAIFILYYFKKKSAKQIAEELHLTYQYVRNIKSKIEKDFI